jgi:hypothetical protein
MVTSPFDAIASAGAAWRAVRESSFLFGATNVYCDSIALAGRLRGRTDADMQRTAPGL